MSELTRKEEFINKYKQFMSDDVQYIFIDIKKKRLPAIETQIVRKESFEAKLKEIKYMYDDNMYLRVPESQKERYEGKPPIVKVVGIYSENYFNYHE